MIVPTYYSVGRLGRVKRQASALLEVMISPTPGATLHSRRPTCDAFAVPAPASIAAAPSAKIAGLRTQF